MMTVSLVVVVVVVCSNLTINFLSQNKLFGDDGDEEDDPHVVKALLNIVFTNTIDGKSTVEQHRVQNEALYALAEALQYVF